MTGKIEQQKYICMCIVTRGNKNQYTCEVTRDNKRQHLCNQDDQRGDLVNVLVSKVTRGTKSQYRQVSKCRQSKGICELTN